MKKLKEVEQMHEIKNEDTINIANELLKTDMVIPGFGFNGHFIYLIPTAEHIYLAYVQNNNFQTTRLFRFLEVGKHTEKEVKNKLIAIRHEYGYEHDNKEYDEDYQEIIDYLKTYKIKNIEIV